jgi:hypothetical protein
MAAPVVEKANREPARQLPSIFKVCFQLNGADMAIDWWLFLVVCSGLKKHASPYMHPIVCQPRWPSTTDEPP